MMTTTTAMKIERMLRELMSDLTDLVRDGEMTDIEANEWYNMKADQWAGGMWFAKTTYTTGK